MRSAFQALIKCRFNNILYSYFITLSTGQV